MDFARYQPSEISNAPPSSSMTPANIKGIGRSRMQREKVFPCRFDRCRKVFDAPYKLDNHFRTHTDERPYECSLEKCNRTFKWRSSLAQHQRQHIKNDGAISEDFSPAKKKRSISNPAFPPAPTAGSVLHFGNLKCESQADIMPRDGGKSAASSGFALHEKWNAPEELHFVMTLIEDTEVIAGPSARSLSLPSPSKDDFFNISQTSFDFKTFFDGWN